jgi:membrane-associated phospholipid phosphatase
MALLREAWAVVREHRWYFIAALLVVLGTAAVTVHYDAEWMAELTTDRSKLLRRWARGFTRWGDYHTGSLFLALTVGLAGVIARRPRLRQAGLATLLAASLAGLSANVFRGLVGRPRPVAELPDGLYGPSLRFELQGSPSAHAATSVGTASALAVSVPVVGVPALVLAGGVVWSRLYLRHHQPTDVVLGSGLGGIFGVALGLAVRRRLAIEAAQDVAQSP